MFGKLSGYVSELLPDFYGNCGGSRAAQHLESSPRCAARRYTRKIRSSRVGKGRCAFSLLHRATGWRSTGHFQRGIKSSAESICARVNGGAPHFWP
jgi:hypothetical protein